MEHSPAPQASSDVMEARIMRFKDLKGRGIPLMFIDSILPGHQRMNYSVIGDTASENPEFAPIITAPHRFQIGMVKAQQGNGPAYHSHDYVESFLPLSGRWRFYWGSSPDLDKIEGETVLDAWDYISLPPGLYRGFEVVSEGEAWLFAVLEPHDVFSFKDPYWAPHVEEAAKQHGFYADANGKMIKPDNYDELRARRLAKLDSDEG